MILVDDHPIVLSGLVALVESDPAFAVVGTARTATEARSIGALADVAVVDLQLPDGDGISLGVELQRANPGLRVLILTMHADDSAVVRSLGAGLDGYVLKDSDPEDLLAAIHSVARGSMVLGPGASRAVVAAAASAPRLDVLGALDAREMEILELLAQGLTTGQVAARLFLAPKTIRNRISTMVSRLGVDSRDEAIALARRSGLGPP